MSQDFTVKKKAIFVWKKNSCRGVHLKKNSCPSSEQKKKNSCKLKIPSPPHHFSNGPSLKVRQEWLRDEPVRTSAWEARLKTSTSVLNYPWKVQREVENVIISMF